MMIHYGPVIECCLKVLCLVIELSCGVILQEITTFLYSGMFSGHPSMQIVYWTGEVLFCLFVCFLCFGRGGGYKLVLYTNWSFHSYAIIVFPHQVNKSISFPETECSYLLYKELHLLTKMKD